jgi:hypothetical protein
MPGALDSGSGSQQYRRRRCRRLLSDHEDDTILIQQARAAEFVGRDAPCAHSTNSSRNPTTFVEAKLTEHSFTNKDIAHVERYSGLTSAFSEDVLLT